ncbi:MAG: mechanosensitive ion channel family protein [Aequorivita sp.]
MIEFFETYQTEFLYALLVICAMLLLRFLTHQFYKWIIKEERKKYHELQLNSFRLVRRIVNTIWLVLGLMAIGSLFFNDVFQRLQNNFRMLLYIGLVSVITIILASSVNIWFRKKVELKLTLKEDPTTFKFMRYIAVFMVYVIGLMFVLLAFPSLKGVAQTALGGAGVLALIIGVASQEALANLVGGVFIISFKPFKIGDIIRLSDSMVGTVVDITLRHTVLRSFENKMIVIPNAIINKEKIINYNLRDLKICELIEIGISYDSDVDLAKKIMREECQKHPMIFDNRSATDVLEGKPIIRVALISLNDFSVTIRAWAWARNYSSAFEMKCDLLESIKKRFEEEGIEIPFPYRTVVFKDNKVEPTS